MADWGITTGLGLSAGLSTVRVMGGTFDGGTNQELRSLSVYLQGTGSVRIAVYQGGDLSTGPDGATLVWDGGTVAAPGTAGWVTATHPGPTYPSLTNNDPTWISIKSDTGNKSFYYSSSSSDAGDFQTARGRYVSNTVTTDEDVAYPSTWPTDGGSFSNFWHSVYLTHESGSTGSQAYYNLLRRQ